MTINEVKAEARKHGGQVVPDGSGGYDLLAPNGKLWEESETWQQPIPLGEAESAEEKQDMLRTALNVARGGLRKAMKTKGVRVRAEKRGSEWVAYDLDHKRYQSATGSDIPDSWPSLEALKDELRAFGGTVVEVKRSLTYVGKSDTGGNVFAVRKAAETYKVGDTVYDADSSSPGKVTEVTPTGTIYVDFGGNSVRYNKQEQAQGMVSHRNQLG